jgi:hypothetical protein
MRDGLLLLLLLLLLLMALPPTVRAQGRGAPTRAAGSFAIL